MSKEQEVIDGYLEKMKGPEITKAAFEELAARIDRLKAMAQDGK